MTIAWGTKVITVQLSDLTLLGGTTYEYDVNDFRLDMTALQDDQEGMPFPDTHINIAPVTLGGIQLARVVEIINGYTVQFVDGQYGVNIKNGNTNLPDVLIRNQVSVLTQNSAGLVAIDEIDYMIQGTVGNADVNADDDEITIRDRDLNVIRQLSVSNDTRVRRIL